MYLTAAMEINKSLVKVMYLEALMLDNYDILCLLTFKKQNKNMYAYFIL